MARNRHPFEGERKRAALAEGRYRLWTGHGGEWVTRIRAGRTQQMLSNKVYLPVRPLQCVARVPSLEFANRVIARRTGGRVVVRRINARGLTRDKQTDSWWLVTDF